MGAEVPAQTVKTCSLLLDGTADQQERAKQGGRDLLVEEHQLLQGGDRRLAQVVQAQHQLWLYLPGSVSQPLHQVLSIRGGLQLHWPRISNVWKESEWGQRLATWFSRLLA